MTDNTNPNLSEDQLTDEQRELAARYRSQLDGQVDEVIEDPNPPQRPDHIPEKFWDAEKGEIRVEDLAKSYAELEKTLSQRQQQQPQKPAKDGDGTASGENEGEGNENEDAYAAGVKQFASLREQATAKLVAGEALDEEMYAGFEKHGLTREDVDGWIAGQEALGTLARMEVHAEVGGEDTYKAMIEWAKANYSPEEIEVYDRDIHSGSKAVRLAAAKGLLARFQQANGTNGKNVTNKGGARTYAGYNSRAEMVEDMGSPRYAKDSAFRAEVARKVAAARAAGIDLFSA